MKAPRSSFVIFFTPHAPFDQAGIHALCFFLVVSLYRTISLSDTHKTQKKTLWSHKLLNKLCRRFPFPTVLLKCSSPAFLCNNKKTAKAICPCRFSRIPQRGCEPSVLPQLHCFRNPLSLNLCPPLCPPCVHPVSIFSGPTFFCVQSRVHPRCVPVSTSMCRNNQSMWTTLPRSASFQNFTFCSIDFVFAQPYNRKWQGTI